MEQSNRNHRIISNGAMIMIKLSISMFFGVFLPIVALAADHYMKIMWMGGSLLYTVGAIFLLPRMTYLYIVIGSGILTLFLWLIYFRTHHKRYGGFIGGILLFNALFYAAFGIAGVYRLLIIPVWLPPFCAAPVLFLSSIRAIKNARSVLSKPYVIVSFIAGFLSVIILSLVVVKQPWELIKHLPNAKGANLSGMNLSHIYLDGCTGVTFEEADLSQADLSYAWFVNCEFNMQKANLYGADLKHAVLSIVNLTKADLRGANLNDASIYQTDFTGSDFRDASLGFRAWGRVIMENTNLCGTDLRGIKNTEGVYVWKNAIYDSNTLWPEDFDPVQAGVVLHAEEKTTK